MTSTALLADVCYAASLLSSYPLIQGLLSESHFPLHELFRQPLQHAADVHGLPSSLQALAVTSSPSPSTANAHCEFLHLATDAVLDNMRASLRAPAVCNTAPAHFRKRLNSTATPSAIRPIPTIPQSYLGTRVAPEVWRTMISFRLWSPVFSGAEVRSFCESSQCRTAPILNVLRL